MGRTLGLPRLIPQFCDIGHARLQAYPVPRAVPFNNRKKSWLMHRSPETFRASKGRGTPIVKPLAIKNVKQVPYRSDHANEAVFVLDRREEDLGGLRGRAVKNSWNVAVAGTTQRGLSPADHEGTGRSRCRLHRSDALHGRTILRDAKGGIAEEGDPVIHRHQTRVRRLIPALTQRCRSN